MILSLGFFLEFAMNKMGFSPEWRKWMMECVSTATISVLVNGSPTDEFGLGRGLRQGDSLSSLLFIIVAEGLSVMMSHAVDRGLFSGYKLGGGALEITHLQYVDDTLLMGEATWDNIWAIKCVLQLFEAAFGLKVNFNKSQLLGFNLEGDWLDQAARVLHCSTGAYPSNTWACQLVQIRVTNILGLWCWKRFKSGLCLGATSVCLWEVESPFSNMSWLLSPSTISPSSALQKVFSVNSNLTSNTFFGGGGSGK